MVNFRAQTGDGKWITSDEARTDVHHLRHTHDAILVGVQTVLHDNPFLTTRLPHGGKNPIRIILDRCLRTPKTAHVITDEYQNTVLISSFKDGFLNSICIWRQNSSGTVLLYS